MAEGDAGADPPLDRGGLAVFGGVDDGFAD